MKIGDIVQVQEDDFTKFKHCAKPERLPELYPMGSEMRGVLGKRMRDEREPGRIVNGARQPDDLNHFERLAFNRANGEVAYAASQEQP